MFKEKILKKLPLILFVIFFVLPLLKSKIIFFILVLILIIFLIKFLRKKDFSFLQQNKNGMGKIIDVDMSGSNKKKMFFSFLFAIFIIWLFFASIIIVEAGETGVYSLFGKVKDEELRSGFHLVIPLAHITKMDIRTQGYTMSIAQNEGKKTSDDSITSLTKEGLEVSLDLTVLFRLKEESASDVYRTIGLDYEEKIIRSAIRTTIREVVAQYEAKDLYSEKRQEASAKLLQGLRDKMENRGLEVEDVLLRNVALPPNLAKSIQEKLQAEQETQKYDFLLDKEKKEKLRKIIEAEGQRDSQKIINESLSQNFLNYLYIKELKDREGTIYVPISPTSGMPLFNNVSR